MRRERPLCKVSGAHSLNRRKEEVIGRGGGVEGRENLLRIKERAFPFREKTYSVNKRRKGSLKQYPLRWRGGAPSEGKAISSLGPNLRQDSMYFGRKENVRLNSSGGRRRSFARDRVFSCRE